MKNTAYSNPSTITPVVVAAAPSGISLVLFGCIPYVDIGHTSIIQRCVHTKIFAYYIYSYCVSNATRSMSGDM